VKGSRTYGEAARNVGTIGRILAFGSSSSVLRLVKSIHMNGKKKSQTSRSSRAWIQPVVVK
jgi:hypothetical protein